MPSAGIPLREAIRFRRASSPASTGRVALTDTSYAVAALQQATRTVPIVFVTVVDPVSSGFVDSLARPGGNITGFSLYEYSISGKWLELLKEIAPGITRAAVIRDPALTAGGGQLGVIQAVAPSVGAEVIPVNVRDAGEIERAITAFARSPNGGLIVTGSTLAAIHREACGTWSRDAIGAGFDSPDSTDHVHDLGCSRGRCRAAYFAPRSRYLARKACRRGATLKSIEWLSRKAAAVTRGMRLPPGYSRTRITGIESSGPPLQWYRQRGPAPRSGRAGLRFFPVIRRPTLEGSVEAPRTPKLSK